MLQSVHGPAQTRALAPHRLGERRGWPAIAEIFHINVWFFYGLTPQYITAAAQFEWDDNKDAEYQAKHHVSFRDAQGHSLIRTALSPKTWRTAKPKSVFTVSAKRVAAS
jgi:hypothetical protein